MATRQHHDDAKQETTRDRHLNPAGILPALVLRRVFGDINCRAAIFTAQRQPLKQPHADQQRGCPYPRCRIGRQETDRCGGAAHQRDRDEERIFPPDLVAEITENNGPQRPHTKPCAKGCETCQRRCRRIVRREKQLAEQRCQNPVEKEIIPFENSPQRRRNDNEPIAFGIKWCSNGVRHALLPCQTHRGR